MCYCNFSPRNHKMNGAVDWPAAAADDEWMERDCRVVLVSCLWRSSGLQVRSREEDEWMILLCVSNGLVDELGIRAHESRKERH